MKNLINSTEVNEVSNSITEQAQAQFFLEDKLERDFHSGFISEEEYKEALKVMPKNVDWMLLADYEETDQTIGSQELACSSAAGCEV